MRASTHPETLGFSQGRLDRTGSHPDPYGFATGSHGKLRVDLRDGVQGVNQQR